MSQEKKPKNGMPKNEKGSSGGGGAKEKSRPSGETGYENPGVVATRIEKDIKS